MIVFGWILSYLKMLVDMRNKFFFFNWVVIKVICYIISICCEIELCKVVFYKRFKIFENFNLNLKWLRLFSRGVCLVKVLNILIW